MESSEPVTSRVSSVLRVYNPFLMTWPFLAFNTADTSQSCRMVKSKALSLTFSARFVHRLTYTRTWNEGESLISRNIHRTSWNEPAFKRIFWVFCSYPRVILSKKFVIFRNGFFTFLPSVAQSSFQIVRAMILG